MNKRLGRHQPGNDIAFVGYLNTLAGCGDIIVNLRVFSRMRPDNDRIFRKRLFKGRDDIFDIFKNSLLKVPEAFGVLTAHAHRPSAEFRNLAGISNRQE